MLTKAGGNFNTMKHNHLNNMDTPLHTAVEIESMEAIQELLDAGAAVTCLNRAGQTPLHVCVKKNLEDHLQVRLFPNNDDNPTAIINAKVSEDGWTNVCYSFTQRFERFWIKLVTQTARVLD